MKHDYAGYEKPASFLGSRYSIGLIVLGAVAGITMGLTPTIRCTTRNAGMHWRLLVLMP